MSWIAIEAAWNEMAKRGDCPLVATTRGLSAKQKSTIQAKLTEIREPKARWPEVWQEFCSAFAANRFCSGRDPSFPAGGSWKKRRGLDFALREKQFGPLLEGTHWADGEADASPMIDGPRFHTPGAELL